MLQMHMAYTNGACAAAEGSNILAEGEAICCTAMVVKGLCRRVLSEGKGIKDQLCGRVMPGVVLPVWILPRVQLPAICSRR